MGAVLVLLKLSDLRVSLSIAPIFLGLQLLELFLGHLVARVELSFLPFGVAEAVFEVRLVGLGLLLELGKVALELFDGLLRDLSLEVQFVLNELVEVHCAFRESLVAELLGNDLAVGSFRALLHEVHHEVFDFNGQVVESLVFLVTKPLGNGLVILLQKKHARLLRDLLVFLLEVLEFGGHFLLESAQVFVAHISHGILVEDSH